MLILLWLREIWRGWGLDTRYCWGFGGFRKGKNAEIRGGGRKADLSFRLRLHSGLWQGGAGLRPELFGPAEAGPFRGLAVNAGDRGGAEVRPHISEARCGATRTHLPLSGLTFEVFATIFDEGSQACELLI
jgi:hypothetical protein